MSFFGQLANKVSYLIHNATHDPEAEKFAKENKAKSDADAAALAKAKADGDAAAIAAAQKKKEENEAAAKEAEEKDRGTFSITRAIGRIIGIIIQILTIFLVIILGVYGSSLATNLNVYQDWPVRLLYAVYGLVFFFLVIPYVLGYRWYWKGIRPRFYSLIPLVPYHFDNYYASLLFSWMSFKPDDVIADLKEWERV
jgi:hypothetical protein